MFRKLSLSLACALVLAGCADDETIAPVSSGGSDAGASEGGSDASADGSTDASDAASEGATDAGADVDPGNASFVVRGSVGQIFVTHASVGITLEARDANDATIAMGTTDHLGSLVFRRLPPGRGYRVHTVGLVPAQRSAVIDVLSIAESLPPQSFYDAQTLVAGNTYVTTRDGTKLAAFVTLPGPASKGPYPTVVNYSGYDPGRPGHAVVGGSQASLCTALPVLCDAPSDASALIAALNGYATVSVNMRGTGCSGGAYDYFETLQNLDGYDVIETVAAQSWVLGHRVGMTGLSYPGISQLFVAKTKPPSLAAITPLSVIGNTATTMQPGGIRNKGFAIAWISNVYDRAAPYGQGWEQARVDGGDSICEENQLLHDQRVNNVEQAKGQKYYDPAIVDPLNPTFFADQIEVPVFLAGGYQDEQTGPYFVTLLDKLKNAKHRRFTVYNGVHPDGFAPQVLTEWKAFLDLYVAKRKPFVDGTLKLIAPQLTQQIFGVALDLPADRFVGVASYADALAQWESEPEIRAIFENGATDPLGAPHGSFERAFDAWPPKQTAPMRLYFEPDGTLGDAPPPANATSIASRFLVDETAGDRGILASGGVWGRFPNWDWRVPADGYSVAFTSAPLEADLLTLGTSSVDLWMRTDAGDADVQVTLSEVRPDGTERYVQSGWLRASERKLGPSATDLWPEPTFLEVDSSPMPAGQWEKVRVAVPIFGHPFRAGSRVRVSIDTPGGTRADWRFELLPMPSGTHHDVAHSATMPSSVLLPVIGGASVPTPLPPCASVRGQPCRTYVATTNVDAGG